VAGEKRIGIHADRKTKVVFMSHQPAGVVDTRFDQLLSDEKPKRNPAVLAVSKISVT